MTQLIETPWKKYGKHRVYLKTAEGDDVGHVDLVSRTVTAKLDGYEAQLEECLLRWTDVGDTPAEEVAAPILEEPAASPIEAEVPEAEPDVPAEQVDVDLSVNVAGAAVRAKRNEVNAQAPVLNFVARVLGVKTEERAWRVGAKGEEKVAKELAELGPRWRVLHAVPVGENGSDIDHVVIGPAGVITLNAKRHPRGRAWIGERAIIVNGQRTDYLRNSRFEAKRASRLLSAACGRAVDVTAAIVFVDLENYTVKQMPADVQVTTRLRLVKWLRSLPVVLDDTEVEEIYARARLASTWT